MVVQQHSEIHFSVSIHITIAGKTMLVWIDLKCEQIHGKEITLNYYIQSHKPTALGPSPYNLVCSDTLLNNARVTSPSNITP